ncbi:MAG: fumarate reductase subunit C [Accumulibacter sp.]|uniref:fumarate reductase subunit C n=1 Tax=Accumulibacter sp. TaxID=2053492 RepID=UPI002FC33EED
MNKRRPYVRSMDGWWRRNPYFVEYMIHEGTALFVAAYAGILLNGLLHLSQGEAAWNAWLAALKSPFYIGFHVLALIALTYHTYTWFKIMPRTMPPVVVGGQRLSACVITGSGLAVASAACLGLLALVWGMAR